MLRQIVENIKLVKNQLLTFKNFSIRMPYILWRNIVFFFYWYTMDYDIGHALAHSWLLWSVYVSIDVIHSETSLFCLLVDIFLGAIDLCIYSFEFCVSVAIKFWLPCLTACAVGIGGAYQYYKDEKEMHELMWSYVDDEDDVEVDFTDFLPVPGAPALWGDRDEDIEPVENFRAPTLYLKISGIIGFYPGLTLPGIIGRVNKALKDKLAPNVENGQFPWVRMSVKPNVALIYVHFNTLQDATNCFNTLDGYTFDGRLVGILFLTEERYNRLFKPSKNRSLPPL